VRQDSRDIVSLRIIKGKKIWLRHRYKPGAGGGLLLHHHVPVFHRGNALDFYKKLLLQHI
jgi:hypothetical protein